MAIDRALFAANCVADALEFGVNAHYLVGVAQLRSGINDNSQGDRIGPYRFTQQEFDANSHEPDFGMDFQPSDINTFFLQIGAFAIMTYRSQNRLVAQLNRFPSAVELYRDQFPNDPAQLPQDLQKALDATADLMGPAAQAVLEEPMNPPPVIADPSKPPPVTALGNINPAALPAGRADIANMIMTAFATAGFGKVQQVTALANAIRESNLNPTAHSKPPEDSVGLFQLNRGAGLGKGHSTAELQDPQKNIAIIINVAKSVGAFVQAPTLAAAVAAFVRQIERPANTDGEIAARLKIAQKLTA